MSEKQVWLTETMWMRNLADLGTVSMDFLEILPGAVRTPVVHDDGEEILYILSGELEMHLGDDKFPVTRGDVIPVPRHVPHGSINRSEAVVHMLAVNSPAFRPEDEKEAAPPAETEAGQS
ncbi:cupin domain-containing protein [Streptomyces sp. NPDC048430]|uniref:cupin domain-containing protein n=1 Tax=unclassified Streptomyces TaxID=2593676 RepID=UPI003447F519